MEKGRKNVKKEERALFFFLLPLLLFVPVGGFQNSTADTSILGGFVKSQERETRVKGALFSLKFECEGLFFLVFGFVFKSWQPEDCGHSVVVFFFLSV